MRRRPSALQIYLLKFSIRKKLLLPRSRASMGGARKFISRKSPSERRCSSFCARRGQNAESAVFETIEQKDSVALSLEGLKPVRVGPFVVHGALPRQSPREPVLASRSRRRSLSAPAIMARRKDVLPRSSNWRASESQKRALDLGTGTGVLAIAAARRFRRKVVATDFDPVAVNTARENSRVNRAANFIRFAKAAGATPHLSAQTGVTISCSRIFCCRP